MCESKSMKSFCGVNSDPITAGDFSYDGCGNRSTLPFHTTDDEKMAAVGVASEFTKCDYCCGIYREPKRLPCLHTFCLRCLEQLISSVDIDNENEQVQELNGTLGVDGAKKIIKSEIIECPTCGLSFTVPDGGLQGIQANDFVNRLVEICQSQPVSYDNSNVCISSCNGTGDRRCERSSSSDVERTTSEQRQRHSTNGDSNNNNYSESFWETSSAERRQSDVLAGQTADCEATEHKPAATAAASAGRALCRRHNSQPFVTFCSEPTCSTPVCITCTLVGHRNHSFIELEDAADQLRQRLRRQSSDIAGRLTVSRARVTGVTDRYKKADDKYQQMRCQVSQHFDEIIRCIEESRDRCLNDIDSRYTKDVEPLLKCREMAVTETARLEKAISSIETVLKTDNNFDVFEMANDFEGDSSEVIDDEVCTEDDMWCINNGNEFLKSLDLRLKPIVNNLLENVSTLCARNASCCATVKSAVYSETLERVSTDTVVCSEATDRNVCVGDKLHVVKDAQNCVETTASDIESKLSGNCLKDLTLSQAAAAMPSISENTRPGPSRLSNDSSGNNGRESTSDSIGGRAAVILTASSNANGPDRPHVVSSLENALQKSNGRAIGTPLSALSVVRAGGHVKYNGTLNYTPRTKNRSDFYSSDSDSNQSSSLTTSSEKLEFTSDTNSSDTENGSFGVVVYNLPIPFGCIGGGPDDVDFFLDLCHCALHCVPEVELSKCRRLGNLPPWLTPSHYLVEDLWRTATYKIPLLITCKKASDAQLLVSEASRLRDAFNIEGFKIKTYHPPTLETRRSPRLQRSYSKD